MDNVSRMADQIRVEEDVRMSTARRASMIEAFAHAGRSVDYAAEALKLKPKTIKEYAKRFAIEFQS